MDTLDYQLKYKDNQEVLDLVQKLDDTEKELREAKSDIDNYGCIEDEYQDLEYSNDKLEEKYKLMIENLDDLMDEVSDLDHDEICDKIREILDDV